MIMDLTVREVVTVMGSLYPHPLPVDEVLDLTGMTPLARRRTQKLSGGQTQRLRFALALVANPDLLVLDEPTVAMDVEARRSFWATMRRFTARGTTVVFATHYLEEADEFADRVVLMAHGRIVADGPSTEIKSRVGMRTIRATLPGVAEASLARLPGVATAERHGAAVALTCTDSDVALRALLAAHDAARDIEITGAGLEEAFLEITGRDDPEEAAA
jgi:ABC-2 type transport system ATP-binding protein